MYCASSGYSQENEFASDVDLEKRCLLAVTDSRFQRASPRAPLVQRYSDSALLRALLSSALVAPALLTLYSVERRTFRNRFCQCVSVHGRPGHVLFHVDEPRDVTYLKLGTQRHHTHLVSTNDGLTRAFYRLIGAQLWHPICKEQEDEAAV